MAAVVEGYHAPVVDGRWPAASLVAVLVVVAGSSLSLGMFVFSGAEKRFAEHV
jgi:ABC-type polysaccharide/polyol phosphate export permease